MDQKKKLSRDLVERFREFITLHPPSLFSRHLRCLLFEYMICQLRTGFPVDFNVHLRELSDFFDLLDCAADEWEGQKENQSL